MTNIIGVPDKMRENKLKYLSENSKILVVRNHRVMRNGMIMTHIQFTEPTEQLYNYLKAYAPVKDIQIFQDTMFLNEEQFNFISSHATNVAVGV